VEKGIRNVAYALLSGADGWMFDGEDALGQVSTMSLENQRSLKLAIARDPMFLRVAEQVAAEMNGWAQGFFGRPIIADWKGQLDFTTRISPICECVRIGSTLRDQWAYAAAVFHVRILGPDRNHEQVMGRYRHAAQVVTILKGSSDAGNRTISLVQNQAGYTPEPYDPGQEFVMFLDSADGGYGVLNDEPGLWSDKEKEPYPAVIFRVENGRIQSAPPGASRFVGASRDALFKELRALR